MPFKTVMEDWLNHNATLAALGNYLLACFSSSERDSLWCPTSDWADWQKNIAFGSIARWDSAEIMVLNDGNSILWEHIYQAVFAFVKWILDGTR